MLLLDSDDSIKISLNIQSIPATSRLISSFGIQLKIFEAALGDQDHVVVTGQLPGYLAHCPRKGYCRDSRPNSRTPNPATVGSLAHQSRHYQAGGLLEEIPSLIS